MFRIALFVLTKKPGNKPKCLLIAEWANELWWSLTAEFSENEQISCTITWFNLQDVRLSRKKQSTKKKYTEQIKLKCKKIYGKKIRKWQTQNWGW